MREVVYIRDADGVVRSSWKFVRAHPDWYAYDGHYIVGSEIRHVFVLIL